MSDWLVVLDTWPPRDIAAAAAAWQQALGGAAMDHARTLRSCTGIPIERIDEPQARQLASALTAAGAVAWPAQMTMLPRLPRPRTASRLQLQGDALHAQVALTGPPETIALAKIVLVLPAAKIEVRTTGGGVKKPKVGIGTIALAATTGLGAGKVLKAARGKGEAVPLEVDESTRPLVEIVAVGPLRRYHAFADRLDYSVLGDQRVQGKRNFTVLLSQVAAATRPELASRPALDRYLADGTLPSILQVEDNNGLAAVSRWLLLRGAMRRLAAATARSPR